MFLNKDQLKQLDKNGWRPFNTKDGIVWFGGKSHFKLIDYIEDPEKDDRSLEDIDFLVVAYSKKEED
tara:strand:+ start:47 stop:247 length:201 start_codon:yes stop_codon:yes gene_type:complete